MQVYIVYCLDVYVDDYPIADCDVIGVCLSKEKAFEMVQEYGRIIERRCQELGATYDKIAIAKNDNWRLYYNFSNGETASLYCTLEESDTILLENDS